MYEELVKALREHAKPDGWDCSVCMCRDAQNRGFFTCTEELAAKAADAIEELTDRIDGKWLFWQDDPDANVYECSACHEPLTLNEGTPRENNFNYCPFCGAKKETAYDNKSIWQVALSGKTAARTAEGGIGMIGMTCAKCPYKKECDDWPDDISCAEFLKIMKDNPPKEET